MADSIGIDGDDHPFSFSGLLFTEHPTSNGFCFVYLTSSTLFVQLCKF